MFKKIVMVVLTVVAIGTGLIMGLNKPAEAHAEEAKKIEYSKAERNVLKIVFEMQDDYEDLEEEEKKTFTSFDYEYTDLGFGIYDIKLIFGLKNDLYEAHIIYDGLEDEDIAMYGVLDGERIDIDEWNDILETKYDIVF